MFNDNSLMKLNRETFKFIEDKISAIKVPNSNNLYKSKSK